MKKEERAKLNILKLTIEYLRCNHTHYSIDLYYKNGICGMDYTITRNSIFLVTEYYDIDNDELFLQDDYNCNYDIIKYYLDNDLDIEWGHDSNNTIFNFINIHDYDEIKRLYNSTIYEIYKDRFCNLVKIKSPGRQII